MLQDPTPQAERPDSGDNLNSLRLCSLRPKVPLGRLLITPGALGTLSDSDIHGALFRHIRRDWGDVNETDWKENNFSLVNGFRIVSSFKSERGEPFWIITEADRSATTILLPQEY
jgi:hypothetical protein